MKWIDKIIGKKEGEKAPRDTWIIMALLGVLLLIIFLPTGSKGTAPQSAEGGITDGGSDKINEKTAVQEAGTEEQTQVYARALEERLEQTLGCIDGAGAVKVMITLKSTQEAVVEKDTPVTRNNTVETDAQGGSRNVNEYTGSESTVYGTDAGGVSEPYVIKKLEPAVEGVVVIAQGGGNEKLCKNITEAIQALFGIEAHKIKVVKMKTLS